MNRLWIILLVSIFLLALSPVGMHAIVIPGILFLLCEDKNKILKKITKTKKQNKNLILFRVHR